MNTAARTKWTPDPNAFGGYWRQAKDHAADTVYKAIDSCRLSDQEGWDLYNALQEKTGKDIVETAEMLYNICTEYNGMAIGHICSAITKEGAQPWTMKAVEITMDIFVEYYEDGDDIASAAIDTFDDIMEDYAEGLS